MAHEKILVVDNDEEYLNLIVSDLQRHEYMVKSTTDGAEALSWILDGNGFDILVTDLLIPNIKGDELVYKARSADENLQAIIITASESTQDAIRTMREYGAFDYLIKPLDQMSQLRNAVERAAQERRLHIRNRTHVQQLLLETSKLDTLVSFSKDGILVVDEQGHISLVNSTALSILNAPLAIGRSANEALPLLLQNILSIWREKFDTQFSFVELGMNSEYSLGLRISPMMDEHVSNPGYLVMINKQYLQQSNQYTEGDLASQNVSNREYVADLQRSANRLKFLAGLKQVNKQMAMRTRSVEVQKIVDQLVYHWNSPDMQLRSNVDEDAKVSVREWSMEQLIAGILALLEFSETPADPLVLNLSTSNEYLWIKTTHMDGTVVRFNPLANTGDELDDKHDPNHAEADLRAVLFSIGGLYWRSPYPDTVPSLAIPLS